MQGSIRLFRIAGIQVFLHFTWFIVGALEVTQFARRYHDPLWALWEYLALFLIVLLHEFGHAFACRQTGGEADRIVLWPLGGIAFVNPPRRPGAYLWSIAAGPLVNVVLFPIFTLLLLVAARFHLKPAESDLALFLLALWSMNTLLLVFNLLPVYPLDGGQIVRGLLWFRLGEIRSLQISSVIGFVGAVGFAIYAIYRESVWFGVLAFFLLSRAAAGWQQAKAMAVDEDVAKRDAIPPFPPEAR